MDHARTRQAAEHLLGGVELSEAELAARLVRARDVDYWRRLAPGLTLDGTTLLPALATNDAALRTVSLQFQQDRYFRTPPLLPSASLAALNRSIDIVVADGWPPVFALIYDPLWSCCRLPALATLLTSHLGPGFVQIPHLWVHVVPAVTGAVGWMPHADGFRPARVSMWLALTDATLDNGCMHIVPPDALPDAFRTMNVNEPVTMSDALRAMQSARAMPIPAGAALGWEFDVFHWGGRAVRPLEARRAISMEFLAAGYAPESDESPLLDATGPFPSFGMRLHTIAIALQVYSKREPIARRYLPLAAPLLS
jgi:hypothetical protein